MALPSLPLVVLDTETTGFIPRTHRIIEYAAVVLRDGKTESEMEQLFSIDEEIPPHVKALTHISDDDLKGQPTFAEKQTEILAAIPEDAVIVGQNVGFDLGMLRGEGIDLTDRPWIDTSMIASLVFPELASYSLGYMSEALDLPHEPVHRALGDVNATIALLEKCWGRLSELPEDMCIVLRDLSARSSAGYQKFFASLHGSDAKEPPAWLHVPSPESFGHQTYDDIATIPEKGTVLLQEESLDPSFLETVMHSLHADEKGGTDLIAVKNIEASIRRLTLPDGARIHYPPHLLVDRTGVEALLAQKEFTADETTLAMKLYLYDPQTRADLPIHGDEYAVWNAKITCTPESEEYRDMLKESASVILLDHHELLTRASDGTLPVCRHVVIDDASMLEDSTTRALGWYCALRTLRAAAEGNDAMTKVVDLAELWTERVRGGSDVRYLTAGDLSTPDVRGLREQITDVLPSAPLPARLALNDLLRILDAENIGGRIAWIETRMDGEKTVQSVPRDTATLLKDLLYDRMPTTLLVPPGESPLFPMILPRGNETDAHLLQNRTTVPIAMEKGWDDHAWMYEETQKSIVLVASRRALEEMFVKHAAPLEEKGITLFCQGMSGGQGRMQAQFTSCKGPAIMAMTPWTYEGVELPPDTVSRIALASLPFDHPSHAVVSQRSELFSSGFMDYMLPRTQLRLFRILRTFCRHRMANGTFHLCDARVTTKEYGKVIREFLMQFSAESKTPQGQKKPPEKPKVKKVSQKKKADDEMQQALF